MTLLNKIIIIFLAILYLSASAQEIPIEIYLGAKHLNTASVKSGKSYSDFGFSYLGLPDSTNSGIGFDAEFRYKFDEKFKISLNVGFDYMLLYQRNVLEIWEWSYWEERYVDFLPGITADVLNRTLRYTSGDSIFSANFEPRQKMKELNISASLSYLLPISETIKIITSLQFGASFFTRELEMHEKWIKRYDLDNNDTLDYEYKYDLLHFAPEKNGTRFFIAPGLGLRYYVSENYDLEFDFKYTQYIQRKYLSSIAGFDISKNSEKWFPLYSKYAIRVGIVFKY